MFTKWFKLFKIMYAPDGGAGGAGGEDGEDGKGKPSAENFAEEMKKLQAAHAEEMAKVKAELEAEKTAHAKDLREMLLGQKGRADDGEKDFADDLAKKMKLKYGGK